MTVKTDFNHSQSSENQGLGVVTKKVKLSEPLQPFAGFDYKKVDKLPDMLVAAIVQHYAMYARKTNAIAKRNLLAFASVGVRAYFQSLKRVETQNSGLVQEVTQFKYQVVEFLHEVFEKQNELVSMVNANTLRHLQRYERGMDSANLLVKLSEFPSPPR